MDKKLEAFARLLKIMDELREQCPWDKKQTIETIRHLTIEETYELSDAIIKMDYEEIKEELGDILLHIVFYSRIASETNEFDIADVIHTECDKLVRRHPHIYGDVNVNDEEEVKQNWEKIKQQEGKGDKKKTTLGGVPQSLPPLVKAFRMQDKAAQVGFDWPNKDQVWDKVKEEMGEFEAETDQQKREEEFGDLLFSLVNYARYTGINPDDALERTNLKFKTRFEHIEAVAEQEGKKLEDMSLEEMDAIWVKAKQKM